MTRTCDSEAGDRYDQNVEWLSALCGLVRGELTKLMRGSLVALITIDVHNRDIIDYLVRPAAPPRRLRSL